MLYQRAPTAVHRIGKRQGHFPNFMQHRLPFRPFACLKIIIHSFRISPDDAKVRAFFHAFVTCPGRQHDDIPCFNQNGLPMLSAEQELCRSFDHRKRFVRIAMIVVKIKYAVGPAISPTVPVQEMFGFPFPTLRKKNSENA